MRRRAFVQPLGLDLTAWPLTAGAQQADKTAKALGLSVSARLLARTDEVIE